MAAPKGHTTSLSLNFDPSNGGTDGGPLQLKEWWVPTNDTEGAIGLKQIPDVPAIYAASTGVVSVYVSGLSEVIRPSLRVVQYSEFIESLSESCEILFAVDKNGNKAPVTLTYDAPNKRFIPSQPFFGLVRIGQYTTTYRVLKYVPSSEWNPSQGLPTLYYGSVAAIYNNNMVLWQIDTPPPLSNGNAEFEVYRITSQVLVNELGAWEMPLGWPSTPSYPGGVTPVPVKDIGLVTERIHEIGMGDTTGRTWKRTKTVILNQPFASSPTYKPVRSVRSASLPAGLSQDAILKYQAFVAAASASIL